MSRFLSLHKEKSSQDNLEYLNILSIICHCKKKMESKKKKRINNFNSSFFPNIQKDQKQYSKIKSPPSLDLKISPTKTLKKKIKKTMNEIYEIKSEFSNSKPLNLFPIFYKNIYSKMNEKKTKFLPIENSSNNIQNELTDHNYPKFDSFINIVSLKNLNRTDDNKKIPSIIESQSTDKNKLNSNISINKSKSRFSFAEIPIRSEKRITRKTIKRASPLDRNISILNYRDMIYQLERILKNFNELSFLIINKQKTIEYLSNLLNEFADLRPLFFEGLKLDKFKEELNLQILEENCIIKENTLINTLKPIVEKILYKNLINDLQKFNILMEQFILHRNLEYLVNLENRLITCADVYKNRNNNGPFYNIPQSNDHPLFKKIKELEERYGYLEYIPQKERLITEKIDKIIERVKTL